MLIHRGFDSNAGFATWMISLPEFVQLVDKKAFQVYTITKSFIIMLPTHLLYAYLFFLQILMYLVNQICFDLDTQTKGANGEFPTEVHDKLKVKTI